ncbi:hypothetical protein GCM10007301_04610 [Azorhizobium oxalatiphilum]|uniref:Uncharacterized protein n=1 Tax=Azorhizobium oxalatiphilum TaxID=980631 RepID=A0A917BJT2_9HYPH|nr:hypothetical protein [Azorhizobium oxalatiphilum]GGF48431.1 hypothetical protein GCM10007301_04610 [Azorhizobium oxalatiphilum]
MANPSPMGTAAETEGPFAARVLALQGVTIRPEEARALLALVTQLNTTVAKAADRSVTIDACPWSFPTLRAQIAERGEDEA